MLLFLSYDSLSWLLPNSLLFARVFSFFSENVHRNYFYLPLRLLLYYTYVCEAIKSHTQCVDMVVYLFDVKRQLSVVKSRQKNAPNEVLFYIFPNERRVQNHLCNRYYRHNTCHRQTIAAITVFFNSCRSRIEALTMALGSRTNVVMFRDSRNREHAHLKENLLSHNVKVEFSFTQRRKVGKSIK